MVANHTAMIQHEELSPNLKTQIMKRTAMWNRSGLAFVMANRAMEQTKEADSQADDKQTKLVLEFTDKLTCQPFSISDADIQGLQKHFTDRQVAQIIHVIATSNV